MDASTEAAEFVVKESLELMVESTKLLLKGTGKGAVRSLALLAAVMKSQHRTKGAVRLSALLQSGTPLEIFTLPVDQLAQWHQHAKEYGVLYTVIRSKDLDGQLDLVIRQEDAARVTRIMERFSLGAALQASIQPEIQPEQQLAQEAAQEPPKDEIDHMIDQILTVDEPVMTQAQQPILSDEEMEGFFGSAGSEAAPEEEAPKPASEVNATPPAALSPEPLSGTPLLQPETGEQGGENNWTYARVNTEWPLEHPKEAFTIEQQIEIHKGFEKGLSPAQINQFAKPELDPLTMATLRSSMRPSVAEALNRLRSQQKKTTPLVKQVVKSRNEPEVL